MAKEKNRFAGFENFAQAESTTSEKKPEAAIAKSKDPNFKKTTLYLSKATHLRLRTHTLSTEQDMSELVEELLVDYFKRLDS
ncbi:hypothetical protein [Synechocystis sp. PCC 6714]|uniref:hypothetical protein n=1 Tax=Synechocystis sp. (strain PCC 6714) TaxID=1147 RepID=UPI00040B6A0C|nr:hypothetical protein [Synechocystis sp. PCC 6714]AIE76077.1 hypothetical protein D082_40310 [Synechocystis sp. PCC 6714]